MQNLMGYHVISVARDFFEVLISYKKFSIMVLKVLGNLSVKGLRKIIISRKKLSLSMLKY